MDVGSYSYLPTEHIHEQADSFREQHAGDERPVPIFDIVEFRLGWEIRPITRLREDHDVEAFLTQDLKTLCIDNDTFLDDRFLNRLRFSVAHEIGHFILHNDVIRSDPPQTTEHWFQQMFHISPSLYRSMEWQANEFAGRLLVCPIRLQGLVDQHHNEIQLAIDSGVDIDSIPPYISGKISNAFGVSPKVIEIRIAKEKRLVRYT